jgi:hypothetical protein
MARARTKIQQSGIIAKKAKLTPKLDQPQVASTIGSEHGIRVRHLLNAMIYRNIDGINVSASRTFFNVNIFYSELIIRWFRANWAIHK